MKKGNLKLKPVLNVKGKLLKNLGEGKPPIVTKDSTRAEIITYFSLLPVDKQSWLYNSPPERMAFEEVSDFLTRSKCRRIVRILYKTFNEDITKMKLEQKNEENNNNE